MGRLPQRLLSLCLTGALLLPLCQGNEEEYNYDYEATATPDYDYNVTFDYIYLNNVSDVDYGLYEVQSKGNAVKGQSDTGVNNNNNKTPEISLPKDFRGPEWRRK
ncbi:hypothetical protein AGOR_G00209630 [Albula goreensis]|uniref:Uncharacterized protein n=1 Tax=Albula goreensis TaxID=1534307 RepID=A0A8T3CLK8_9TELE|nr:hypothetical protein AGOR_G00209630 [Albula goreensis]